MQVTLNVPDEIAAEARAQGVPVANYAETLLKQSLPKSGAAGSVQDFRAWVQEFQLPSSGEVMLPGATFSREMIYDDRD